MTIKISEAIVRLMCASLNLWVLLIILLKITLLIVPIIVTVTPQTAFWVGVNPKGSVIFDNSVPIVK